MSTGHRNLGLGRDFYWWRVCLEIRSTVLELPFRIRYDLAFLSKGEGRTREALRPAFPHLSVAGLHPSGRCSELMKTAVARGLRIMQQIEDYGRLKSRAYSKVKATT